MLITLIILLIISLILLIFGITTDSAECWFFSTVFGIVFILLLSIGIPVGRCNSRENIREINTLKQTLEIQRKQERDLENAAVISKIIDYNTYINEEKRDNSKWYWDWFIDDAIDTVQLVK